MGIHFGCIPSPSRHNTCFKVHPVCSRGPQYQMLHYPWWAAVGFAKCFSMKTVMMILHNGESVTCLMLQSYSEKLTCIIKFILCCNRWPKHQALNWRASAGWQKCFACLAGGLMLRYSTGWLADPSSTAGHKSTCHSAQVPWLLSMGLVVSFGFVTLPSFRRMSGTPWL